MTFGLTGFIPTTICLSERAIGTELEPSDNFTDRLLPHGDVGVPGLDSSVKNNFFLRIFKTGG